MVSRLTNGPEHVFGLAELQGKIFPHLGVIGLGQETAVIGVDLEVGTVTVPQAGSEMSVHLFDQNIRLNIGDLAGEREESRSGDSALGSALSAERTSS